MSVNNARGGRLLTEQSFNSDYTIRINKENDGSIKFANALSDISNVNDVNNGILRLVDVYQSLPDVSNLDNVILKGLGGRTVIYTGQTTGNYQSGCAYTCVPTTALTWGPATVGASAQVLKFPESLDVSGIGDDDYVSIVNVSGDDRCIIFKNNATGTIDIVFGTTSLADATQDGVQSTPIYEVNSATATRTANCNEIVSNFNGCVFKEVVGGMGAVSLIPTNSPATAFTWALTSSDENKSYSPYLTLYPINNTCILLDTEVCFYFGKISTSSTSLDILIDTSKLAAGKFHNRNIIYFELGRELSISFESSLGHNYQELITKGVTTYTPGKYRATVEVYPDTTIVVNVERVEGTVTQSTSGVIAYGVRYKTTDLSTVEKIELTRLINSDGTATETITTPEEFTRMPCHNFRRCVMDSAKSPSPKYYLHPDNSLVMDDGLTPSNLTGEDGEVMVEIPRAYVRVTLTKSGNDTYINYLMSSVPIPDAPEGSVLATMYNGPHPFFRVGGDLELDSDGNVQYEQRYNNGTMEQTNIILRAARPRTYVGAFQSVRCWHGTTGITPKTIGATAADTSEANMITPSGKFANGDDYPALSLGVPAGTGDATHHKQISVKTTEAKSVAPYRDGDMVYVGMPGVRVIFNSSSSTSPSALPGGCDVVLGCDVHREPSYVLTTDTTFRTGKRYFTRSGEGSAADPYVYTKATVKIGKAIPENTYYNRRLPVSKSDVYTASITKLVSNVVKTFNIKLEFNTTDNKWYFYSKLSTASSYTQIAVSANAYTSDFLTFTGVAWTTSSGTMATTDETARMYVGPVSYGTKNPNFVWTPDNIKTWDDAVAGNPNWALNYRPLRYNNANDMQRMHGNGCHAANNSYYTADTRLLVSAAGYGKDLGLVTFPNDKQACEFVFKSELAPMDSLENKSTNVWYGTSFDGSSNENYAIRYSEEDGGYVYSVNGIDVLKDDDSPRINGSSPDESGTKTIDTVRLVDYDNRYLTLGLSSFVKPFSMEADTQTYYPVPIGLWVCNDAIADHIAWNRTWTATSVSTVYTMSFHHDTFRWYITTGTTSTHYSDTITPKEARWTVSGTKYTRFTRSFNVDSNISGSTVNARVANNGSISEIALTGTFTGSTDVLSRQWDNSPYRASYVATNASGILAPYTGCWVVAHYSTPWSTVDSIVASELDCLDTELNILFRPENPDSRYTQRTYDSATGDTTNTSLVYRSKAWLGTARYIDIFFVDENTTIPAFYTGELADTITAAVEAKAAEQGDEHYLDGRYIMIEYTDSNYDTLAATPIIDYSESIMKDGPWSSAIHFYPNAWYTTSNYHKSPYMLKASNAILAEVNGISSGRGYNANARFNQYLSLMMLIENGSFEVPEKGVRLIGSAYLAGQLPFVGRSVSLGNHSGSVIYDPDIDINIHSDFFGGTAAADRVVAFSYHGIENPFSSWSELAAGVYNGYTYSGFAKDRVRWFTTDLAGQISSFSVTEFIHNTIVYTNPADIVLGTDYKLVLNGSYTVELPMDVGTGWLDDFTVVDHLPLGLSSTPNVINTPVDTSETSPFAVTIYGKTMTDGVSYYSSCRNMTTTVSSFVGRVQY